MTARLVSGGAVSILAAPNFPIVGGAECTGQDSLVIQVGAIALCRHLPRPVMKHAVNRQVMRVER